jgi:hypothetical protein
VEPLRVYPAMKDWVNLAKATLGDKQGGSYKSIVERLDVDPRRRK